MWKRIAGLHASSTQAPHDSIVYVTGSPNCGKTSLLFRLLYDIFPHDPNDLSEKIHQRKYESMGKEKTIEIVETSSLDDEDIKNGGAFILAYDPRDPSSFECVDEVQQRIRLVQMKERGWVTPMAVVPTMADLLHSEDRVKLSAQELIVDMEWALPFIRTSAKEGLGISRLAEIICKHMFIGGRFLTEVKEVIHRDKLFGFKPFSPRKRTFSKIEPLSQSKVTVSEHGNERREHSEVVIPQDNKDVKEEGLGHYLKTVMLHQTGFL